MIPEATIARLPIYHRVLSELVESGVSVVSSEQLAAAAGVTSAKLRRDLSSLGSYGTRGVGYEVDYLSYQVALELGISRDWPLVVIGLGNLGRALVHYGPRGFRVAAVFDADPAKIGQSVQDGLEVLGLDQLPEVVRGLTSAIGVIATPASAAQEVCDLLVNSGVRSILNFAPALLAVPTDVEVRKVDLASELQILAFHEQQRRETA